MNELMLSLVTAAFAWWCALDDADAIAEGKKISHGLQWCLRAAWVLGWCALFDAWLLAVPLAFLFSGVFRLCLNRLRGLDVRYVSPSNWYDTVFILFSISVGQLDIPRRDRFTLKEMRLIMAEHGLLMKASEVHWIDHRDGPDLNILPAWYAKQVHRAGTIAYVFEAVAYGVGIYAF